MDEKKSADVEFPHSPDGPLKVFIKKKTFITEEGFGEAPHTYPVTIVPARYGGTYEGGPWICFPVHAERLAKGQWRDWQGDDLGCAEWWAESVRQGWPIGLGASPDLAYRNLIERAAEKAGINLADWSAEPTWNKDELRRRDGEDHP